MTAPASAKELVDKLWSHCHVLRHDGVSTIDYVDQLTLLLFLKMADARATRKPAARGDELEHEYNRIDITWLRDPALGGADEHLPPEMIAQDTSPTCGPPPPNSRPSPTGSPRRRRSSP